MADPMIPKEALDYLKRKSLKPAFSYRDVWNEEHAAAFTVAKALQVDVLSDIKSAVDAAMAEGKTFREFRNNLRPLLEEKGWWGRATMTDPVSGETRSVQLGSSRRLKTIYDTNLGQAYRAGAWQRGMASDAHPYAMYRIGPSKHHREAHQTWDGLILPKDDPWWSTHSPKNGWGCKCYVRFLTQAKFERYKAEGIPQPLRIDGAGDGTIPVQTERPVTRYKTWVDRRTGRIERLPEGVSPGFGWNPGQAGRDVPLMTEFLRKTRATFPVQFQNVAESIMRNTVRTEHVERFVTGALSGAIPADQLAAVGFLDGSVVRMLSEVSGIDPQEGNAIILQARLLSGPKALRHAAAGDALTASQWRGLTDTLLDAEIYFERKTGNLIYVQTAEKDLWLKVVVTPVQKMQRRGASIKGAVIVSAQRCGTDEANRIFALERLR